MTLNSSRVEFDLFFHSVLFEVTSEKIKHFLFQLSRCRIGLVSPKDFKIDFLKNFIFGSATYFFVNILKFSFTFFISKFMKQKLLTFYQNLEEIKNFMS